MGGQFAVCAALAVLALGESLGRAEPPARARLVYVRQPGAERCPGEDEIAGEVERRLGYSPFQEPAATTLSVIVGPRRGGWQATIELWDELHQSTGTRELSSTQPTCDEIASAIQLALVLVIDPFYVPRKIAEEPEPPAPPPARSAEPEWLRVRLGLGAMALFATAPMVAAGGTLLVGLQGAHFSVNLALRGDLPSWQPVPGTNGGIGTWWLGVLFTPCYHYRWLASCALVALGQQTGEGRGFDVSNQAIDAWFGVGARVSLEIPLGRRLLLAPHGDVLLSPTIYHYKVDGNDAFVTPIASAALGLALLLYLR